MGKITVKILGLSLAHRKGMNTAWLVQYALEAAKKFGRKISEVADLQTEFIDLADKDFKPCLGYCERLHWVNDGHPYTGTERPRIPGCPLYSKDMVDLVSKIREADGYIIGSSVFATDISSKFKLWADHITQLCFEGSLTNKPVVSVACGGWPFGGQEICLHNMNRMFTGGEMVCVSWLLGVPGISGPPYGPAIGDPDYNTRIGVKNDRNARWLALVNGKRVAEFAVMLKLAKQTLGELFTREFMQSLHPPWGEEAWAWRRLDKEVEEYMNNLEGPRMKPLSRKGIK